MSSYYFSTAQPIDPSSNITIPNFDEYRALYFQQNFSVPESLTFYLIKNVFYMGNNPESMYLYRKLIKSCKYFFIKNPIVVMHCLHLDENEWKTCIKQRCKYLDKDDTVYCKIDLQKIQSKIHVIDDLKISCSKPNIAALLLPKIYKSNVEKIQLHKQNLTFKDLLSFSTKLVLCEIRECNIFEESGEMTPLETIVAKLPKLQYFGVELAASNDFSKTAKELIKIPHFKNMIRFHIYGVSESFDIDLFYDYLKNNPKTNACFEYYEEISDQYKNKLQGIVNEILDDDTLKKYMALFILFRGLLRHRESLFLCLTNLSAKNIYTPELNLFK